MLGRFLGFLWRLSWLRQVRRLWGGPAGQAVAVLLAFTLPLALGGTGSGGGQVRWPSPAAAGSAVLRLADWVTGRQVPVPKGPAQRFGSAPADGGQVPAAVARAVARAVGGPAGQGRGQLPPWSRQAPARQQFTTGKAPGTGGYDAATSTVDTAGSTATSVLYKNADGSYSRQVFPYPVNYRSSSGSWARINRALVAGKGGRWQAKANSLAVSFAPKADSASLTTVAGTDAGGSAFSVSLGLAGAASVTGTAGGTAVRYAGVLTDTDVTASDFATGASEDLVLKSASAPSSWVFPLTLNGLTAQAEPDGSVDLLDGSGQVTGVIPEGLARDSATAAAPGAGPDNGATIPVPWQVVSWNGGTAIKGSVSAAWLADPSRVFPVTVDPQVNETETGSTYVMDPYTADYSGDTLMKVGNDGAGEYARSFLAFAGLGSALQNEHITAATLHLWDAWAWTCSTPEPFEADAITASWSVTGSKSWPGPAIGTQMGTANDTAPAAACTNTAGDPTVGGWMKVPMSDAGLSVLNDWTLHPSHDYGIAVSASTAAADDAQWKQFDSFNTPNAPYLWIDYTPDVAPQIDGQYPPDGYSSPTLTPELIASGSDPDNWPSALQYLFTVYTSSGTKVDSSGLVSSMDWTVPRGDLSWGQTYYWTVQDNDGLQYSGGTPAPQYFSTPVPQPLVTSALSQNPSGAGYDPASGNWTTSATDAQVASPGPALEITRDYNSFDPRLDGAFGAGWSSVLDAGVTPGQTDSSGTTATEVVTYPDGQQVAFGLNAADGTYAPPPGRYAQLRGVSGGGFTLTDKSNTVYTFTHSLGSGSWGITSITDSLGRSLTFGWTSGQIVTITSSASQRALHLAWSGTSYPHVASVTTDDVSTAGTALTWTYTYSGNHLTQVCAPPDPSSGTPCTGYSYTAGSDYPESVLGSGPHSYWRLNEASGTTAASSVLLNEGTDNATYSNVQLASSAGPLAGSSQRSPDFDGTSSYIQLPGSLVNHAAYMSVSLWFRTTITGDGVLFSYQSDPVTNSTTTGAYTPAIYLGTDHKLHAQFWDNNLAPMTTPTTVNDGNWHLVTMTAAGNSQVLYLDGQKVDTKSGTIVATAEQHDYLGAGFLGGSWPDESHQGQNGSEGYESVFRGYLSDAALWDRSLTAGEVTAMYAAGTQPAALATTVTSPRGNTQATAAYDAVTGRVTSVTDAKGGTWGIGAPSVTGSSQVYRSAVLGAGPIDYWRFNDTGTSTAQNQIIGGAAAVNSSVSQGNDGPFPDSSGYHFNGTSSYVQLPSGLVRAGNESVSLWFRTQVSGDVLLSSSATPVTSSSANGDFTPELYIGSDGKLNAQFWNGTISPMVTTVTVTDGKWHNVILSAGTSDERLYLDGALQDTITSGTVTLGSGQVYDYLGAGFIGGSWPDEPNSGQNPAPRSYFTGNIGEVSFFYDEVGNNRTTDLWNASKQSTGQAPFEQVSVTDPGTKTINYAYDPANGNRILSQTDALGRRTTYGYDIRGFLNTVVHPAGDTTVTGHDVRGNEVSQTTCQDQAALKCSTTYSSYYPDDTSVNPPADPRDDLILTSSDGRSASASDTTYQTSYAYDAAGDLVSKTTPPAEGLTAAQRTTSYDYTLPGKTYGGYNGATPPPGLRYKETTPGGAVTHTSYYADGDVAQVTSPDGQVTTYLYDGLGRVTKKTVTFNNTSLVTTYAYNPGGQVTQETDPAVTDRVTSALHTPQITTSYDLDGNVTSRQTADLTGGDPSRTVSWTYTSHDQKQTYTDPYGATTTYTYDPYGNLSQVQQPGGTVVTGYTHDADGELVLTTLNNYAGSIPSSAGCQNAQPSLIESSRTYYSDGQLKSVTDAMCDVTTYGYTNNGLLSTVVRSDGGSASFTEQSNTYDGAGNLTEQVTNNGATTTDYAVDAADRVTSKTLDPAGLDRATSYIYTPDGQVASEQLAVGSGTSVRSTSYTYDVAGNVISKSVALPGAGGPAAWWPLNETSGTSAADSAGNGFTATASGVTWTGGSASFAGNVGQQIATRGPVLDTTGSFTVAAWVNLASTGGTSSETAVSQDAGTDSAFYLKYYPGSGGWQFTRPQTDTMNPSIATADSASTAPATAGTWTFLTGTYDANTGAMTLYVNGAASGGVTDATPVASHGPLVIGRAKWDGGNGDFFGGQVADVQVYQRALSASEVSSLYGLHRGGGKITTDALTTTWTRDQRGLPTSMTNPDGAVTKYTYDEVGRLAVTVAPQILPYVGGQPSTPAVRLTSTGYDTFGETAETEDPDGNETTYAYSSNPTGRVITINPPAYTQPGASGSLPAATTATVVQYNALGQVLSRTTPVGTTSYLYDQLGDVTSVTPPGTTATTYAYYPNGQQASQSGPAGSTTTTYDYLGREWKSTQVETQDAPGSYTTTRTYNASASDPGGAWLSSVASPGVTTSYGYDAAGEMTSVTDGAQNTTSYGYDAAGDKTSVTYPPGSAYDSGTRTTYSYDEAGRRIGSADLSQPDSGGSRSVLRQDSAAYDGEGNLVSSTDYLGNATTLTYDAGGNLTAEVQPVTAATGITVSFGYDAAGNQTLYTDGNGGQWQTTYNSWNEPESRIEPATSQYTTAADSTFTTAYDAAGLPLTVTQPGGVTVSDSYNAMGLLAGQSGTGAGAATADRSFGYDGAGRLTSAATSNTAPSGQPSNATSESFGYDDRGLLTSASGSAGSSSFTWNGDGQVASEATPAGTASYTYDGAGRLQTMADPATGTTLTYAYNSLSQPSAITYGSGGDVRTLTYNAVGELATDALATAQSAPVASIGYAYDLNGDLIGKTTTGFAGTGTNTYTYDQAGRIVSWNDGTTTTAYGYDAAGNLTSDGGATLSYDARDELTANGSTSYSYTASGTLAQVSASWGTVAESFDAYGQQAAVTSRSYVYDALGRDVQASGGSAGTAAFSYLGTGGQVTGDGTSTYTWAPDGTLTATGVAGGTPAQGVLDWTDLHTDVAGQFTPTGTALAASADYDPWGNGVAWAGSGTGSLGYQSQYRDPVTGLTGMGSRWYRASTGGFTSRDTVTVPPVPDPAVANPFAYAGDNPLGFTDPTGHDSIPIPIPIPVGGTLVLGLGGFGTLGAGAGAGGGYAQPGLGTQYWSSQASGAGAQVAVGADASWQDIADLNYRLMQQYPWPKPTPNDTQNPVDGSNDNSGGYSPPPWWDSYRHSKVSYRNDPAPAGNSHPASAAAIAAQIAAMSAAMAAAMSAAMAVAGGGPGGDAARQMAGKLAHLLEEYGPQILGSLAMAGCDVLTGGDGARVICPALGGAVSGASSYLSSCTPAAGGCTLTGLLAHTAATAATWAANGILGPEDTPITANITTAEAAPGLRTPEEAGISPSEAQRIQNAASRTNQRIVVVGSRADGTAGATSDWDYILSGPSRARGSAKFSLPRGVGGDWQGRRFGIDIFQDYNPEAPGYTRLDPSLPHVIFNPQVP